MSAPQNPSPSSGVDPTVDPMQTSQNSTAAGEVESEGDAMASCEGANAGDRVNSRFAEEQARVSDAKAIRRLAIAIDALEIGDLHDVRTLETVSLMLDTVSSDLHRLSVAIEKCRSDD